jgi:predicted Zn-dependent peptidase
MSHPLHTEFLEGLYEYYSEENPKSSKEEVEEMVENHLRDQEERAEIESILRS